MPADLSAGIGQRSLVPLIMLECFVTGGRTLQAYKRGGFEEARERFTEEASVQLSGLQASKCLTT